MKAIVFDLDDTLIIWKDYFNNILRDILKNNYNIVDNELVNKINNCLDTYELHYDKLNKNKLLDYINENCQTKLDISFINLIIDGQGDCYYEDEELKNVIEYLSTKYDLYVISNWFTKTQKKRLENMGVLKYFKEVYGSDENYEKPSKHCFDVILEKYEPSHITVVGDTYKNDIELPLLLGMNAIHISKEVINANIMTIDNVYELRSIL